VTDITYQKEADRKLRESEEKFRTLVENTIDWVWQVDPAGYYTYVNPDTEKIIGYGPDELCGKRPFDFMEAKEAERCGAFFATVVANRERIVAFEDTMLHKDGYPVVFETNATPLFDDEGLFQGYFGTCRDITERKQAEEEKTSLEEQFHQAQKMEAIGRLAGGVAHDFNNILTVILGHTEMAQAQVDPAQPLFADLSEIHQAAERSANLTRQLLAFARKQTISPQVLDLNETVEGMLKMLRRLIGEEIDLAWLPRTGLWPVNVDPSQIDQILANLCINARDAINGTGKVTIETDRVAIDQAYCGDHPDANPGEFVLLAISDNGCGMDKATLNNIFEPFFTTKAMDQGTGLGLATVYGIVKQNHGFINVYSEPGRGTTFKIYLPRYVTETGQIEPEGPVVPAARGDETILLVEDEAAILTVGRRMLEKLGYRVLTASKPGEAIRIAQEHAGEIHLLITDVVMPEMNGRELAQKLFSLCPRLKALFMSGYMANVIAPYGVLEERDNFIQKPFSMESLAARVRQVLDTQ
jgi:PAS domain S-box-containing protein